MSSTASDPNAQAYSIRANLDGLEDLFIFMMAVPEVLEDQDTRIKELDGRIEEGREKIDNLERAYESILVNLQEAERQLEEQQAEIEALREEVDNMRDKQDAVRGLFSDRALDKEDAHVDAKKRDATDIVEVGDIRTVVIDETEYDDPRDPTAIAYINTLVTFVPAPEEDLSQGDEVEVRVSDVGESHARAVRINE